MSDNPYKLIAIDLDGTLVDSVGDLHRAISDMQTSLSLDIATEDDVRSWVGNGVERLVHRALTKSMDKNAQSSLFDEALPVFESAYAACNGLHASLFPGVAHSLTWLSEQNKKMVVVTNKSRRFAEPLLNSLAISHYFEMLVAGDDVSQKKPHPEGLLTATAKLAVSPENSVLIGDSITDIKTARAAGFRSISVSYGYNHGEPILVESGQWKTDVLIDSFDELPQALNSLASI